MWWVLGVLGYLFVGVFSMIGIVAKEYNKSLSDTIANIMDDDVDESCLIIIFWPALLPGILFWVVYRSLLWIAKLMIFGITTLINSLKESSKKEASKSKSSDSKVKEKIKTVITQINEW